MNMNCIQRLMKPGYGNDYLEIVADGCLIPARYFWEERSVEWIKGENDSEIDLRYSTNLILDHYFKTPRDESEAWGVFMAGLIWGTISIVAVPFLTVGLPLKKIALEYNPKAKAYNDLAVQHLLEWDDMSEIPLANREVSCGCYLPGPKANERRDRLRTLNSDLNTKCDDLNNTKQILEIAISDIAQNSKSAMMEGRNCFIGNHSEMKLVYEISEKNSKRDYKITSLIDAKTKVKTSISELPSKINQTKNEINLLQAQINKIEKEIEGFQELPQKFIAEVRRLETGELDRLI